jgi:hypothetical protein
MSNEPNETNESDALVIEVTDLDTIRSTPAPAYTVDYDAQGVWGPLDAYISVDMLSGTVEVETTFQNFDYEIRPESPILAFKISPAVRGEDLAYYLESEAFTRDIRVIEEHMYEYFCEERRQHEMTFKHPRARGAYSRILADLADLPDATEDEIDGDEGEED